MNVAEFTSEHARWQAVENRDVRADHAFVFAVVTTGIFCRPSCRARRPRRENVRFYPDAAAACEAGFRPCKRCQPAGLTPQQQKAQRIADACRLMAQSETPLTLAALADNAAMSPFHFHREFKALTGMTPKAWQKALRAQKLQAALRDGMSVTDSLWEAGFSSGSALYREAHGALGMRPRQYRRGGEQVAIRYAIAPCAAGLCLVAASERGLCAVLLGDDAAALDAELTAIFPRAQYLKADDGFTARVAQVIAWLDAPQGELALPLDLRGTAFQLRVWQALQTVPPGQTISYQELAARTGNPQAVRAAACACAANKLAVIVPCHRVVRRDGALSGYRWGAARKALLLSRERKEET
ncbi:ADA regulatory protein / Methylated-DNA--protein-cysteine methyltransferase [Cronobacter condimenti 1330]|uniref:Regulatory protein of adaptive response n=1 Tax=Cronobacter condimenti 1330 TaxID=1073999 RepID=K8ACV8_9ENTR|nr:bifunctional DNA-binding transcriptional regulator/O6-methylguanine-DNA methyltransferase Ada [Cronobacter condimenti]ALB63402.1 6-O-methylguanine DNA methyltransferase [Cronobacter condimenti 1330]CCJ73594.1 ADA regulatory protein / Methylated-DNA--protein-cysteine methyltransferase [Cronobacter condimenti 1330]